jgi:hypothetical protein
MQLDAILFHNKNTYAIIPSKGLYGRLTVGKAKIDYAPDKIAMRLREIHRDARDATMIGYIKSEHGIGTGVAQLNSNLVEYIAYLIYELYIKYNDRILFGIVHANNTLAEFSKIYKQCTQLLQVWGANNNNWNVPLKCKFYGRGTAEALDHQTNDTFGIVTNLHDYAQFDSSGNIKQLDADNPVTIKHTKHTKYTPSVIKQLFINPRISTYEHYTILDYFCIVRVNREKGFAINDKHITGIAYTKHISTLYINFKTNCGGSTIFQIGDIPPDDIPPDDIPPDDIPPDDKHRTAAAPIAILKLGPAHGRPVESHRTDKTVVEFPYDNNDNNDIIFAGAKGARHQAAAAPKPGSAATVPRPLTTSATTVPRPAATAPRPPAPAQSAAAAAAATVPRPAPGSASQPAISSAVPVFPVPPVPKPLSTATSHKYDHTSDPDSVFYELNEILPFMKWVPPHDDIHTQQADKDYNIVCNELTSLIEYAQLLNDDAAATRQYKDRIALYKAFYDGFVDTQPHGAPKQDSNANDMLIMNEILGNDNSHILLAYWDGIITTIDNIDRLRTHLCTKVQDGASSAIINRTDAKAAAPAVAAPAVAAPAVPVVAMLALGRVPLAASAPTGATTLATATAVGLVRSPRGSATEIRVPAISGIPATASRVPPPNTPARAMAMAPAMAPAPKQLVAPIGKATSPETKSAPGATDKPPEAAQPAKPAAAKAASKVAASANEMYFSLNALGDIRQEQCSDISIMTRHNAAVEECVTYIERISNMKSASSAIGAEIQKWSSTRYDKLQNCVTILKNGNQLPLAVPHTDKDYLINTLIKEPKHYPAGHALIYFKNVSEYVAFNSTVNEYTIGDNVFILINKGAKELNTDEVGDVFVVKIQCNGLESYTFFMNIINTSIIGRSMQQYDLPPLMVNIARIADDIPIADSCHLLCILKWNASDKSKPPGDRYILQSSISEISYRYNYRWLDFTQAEHYMRVKYMYLCYAAKVGKDISNTADYITVITNMLKYIFKQDR